MDSRTEKTAKIGKSMKIKNKKIKSEKKKLNKILFGNAAVHCPNVQRITNHDSFTFII